MRLDQFERAIQTRIFHQQHRELDGECYRSDDSGLLKVHFVEYLPPLPSDDDARLLVRHLKDTLHSMWSQERLPEWDGDQRFYIIYVECHGVLIGEHGEQQAVTYRSDCWYCKIRGSVMNRKAIRNFIIISIYDQVWDQYSSGALRLTISVVHKRATKLPPGDPAVS